MRRALIGLLVLLVVAGAALAIVRGPRVAALAAPALRRLGLTHQVDNSPGPPPTHVTLTVDRSRVLRPISPLIYGLSHASADQLAATGANLDRWGGNPNTRYNWTIGAWNAARDWEFRNYGGQPTAPGNVADSFVATNRAHGVETLLTVPAIGWVASNGNTETRSIGVPSIGGAPVSPGSDAIAGYDPAANRAATSVRSVASRTLDADPTVVAQADFIQHLVSRFGSADAGGVGYYAIDNEPDLWSVTHTDVHPVDPSYEDMLSVFLEYATAIKTVDPSTKVVGPALSGWTSLMYSARDRGSDTYRTHADRLAHGDMPFLAWWLDQVHKHDLQTGERTLDVLDVHYYPQAANVFSPAVDPATARLRLRSTRSLWDPSYVDESWISEPVELIPRLRRWVDQYYPGTPLAINEWNWGADTTMNGALAIANVLGIYGREGVDMAAYWTSPPADSPGAQAFAMFTNYDGYGHGFGDQAIAAKSDAPNDVSVFASTDSSTGDVLVLALNNRDDAAIPMTLAAGPRPVGPIEAFRLSGTGPIAPLADTGPELTLPPTSITLLRLQTQP